MAKPMLTVTNIAPKAPNQQPLEWLDELGGIAKIPNVDFKIVGGPTCNRDAIANAFAEPREVFILTGHGVPGGLAFPGDDGQIDFMGPLELAGLVKAAAPRLMVVALCNSMTRNEQGENLTDPISRRGINVIGYNVEANDRAAVRFNIEIVRFLARGLELGDAFEAAREIIRRINPTTAEGVFLMGGISNGLNGIVKRLDAFECRQDNIERAVEEVRRNVATLMEATGAPVKPAPRTKRAVC